MVQSKFNLDFWFVSYSIFFLCLASGAATTHYRVRLSALIDLYIHPLYVLVSKILSSILNSPVLIHPLYHLLSTLSIMGPTCHFI
jgi:hypothetical protein